MKPSLIVEAIFLHLVIFCHGFPPIIFMSHIGCDFSGFFMEIMGFVQGLKHFSSDVYLDIGKCANTFKSKLEGNESSAMSTAQYNYITYPPNYSESIVIHHKLPGASFSERFHRSSTNRPFYTIGRMMTESAIISKSEVASAEVVDEVWVPTAFHKMIFEAHGMPSSKVFVIPEAVNSPFFKLTPFEDHISSPGHQNQQESKHNTSLFRFVSVFKLEKRKGWDVLLKAYWSAFNSSDGVELVIRSYKPNWERGPSDLYLTFNALAMSAFGQPMTSLAKVSWISAELDRWQLRDLYHSANAFVLPTRGEGWCLPCVEAMACGLPVIVTNFSGPTAYMDEEWSYPLKILNDLNLDGTAEPSQEHLVELLRHVVNEREEAMMKGQAAMKHVDKVYSPIAVGQIVFNHLRAKLYGTEGIINTEVSCSEL